MTQGQVQGSAALPSLIAESSPSHALGGRIISPADSTDENSDLINFEWISKEIYNARKASHERN